MDSKSAIPSLCVFHPIWVFRAGGGGGLLGLGHNVLVQFSNLWGSKMEISKTDFFDILTIRNDQISYVKHVLDPHYVFFTLFGCWDRGKGLRHNLPTQFSTLGGSKVVIFRTNLFANLTVHNDWISHVKHVLDPLMCFSPCLGLRGGGGGGLLNYFMTT